MRTSFSKTWTIPAKLGQEKVIMQEITQAIGTFQKSEDRLDDILTCAAEACLNAIEHGNVMQNKRRVRVSLSIKQDSYILRVYDEGAGFVFQPQQVLLQDKIMEENPRGWGIFLIQGLADSVCTGRKDGEFYIQICFQRNKEKGSGHE